MTVFSQFCKSWPKPVTDIIVVLYCLFRSIHTAKKNQKKTTRVSYCENALQTTQTFKLLNIFTVYISHPD